MGRAHQTKPGVSRVAKRRAGEELCHGEEYRGHCVRSLLPGQPGMGTRHLRTAAGYDRIADCHGAAALHGCHSLLRYRRPLQRFRSDLQKSDAALEAYFLRRDAANGLADYHAFKTRLANVYSARSADNLKSFCRNATASIAIALKDKKNLAELVSSQPISIDDSYTSCGDHVPGGAMVARGAAEASALPAKVAQTAAPPAAPAILAAPAPRSANAANQAEDDVRGSAAPPSNDDQRNYRSGPDNYDSRDYARDSDPYSGTSGYAARDPYARSPYAYDDYYGWYDQPGSYYRRYYGPTYRASVPPPRFYRYLWRR